MGLPLHEPLVDLLRTHGLSSPLRPASVMAFDSRRPQAPAPGERRTSSCGCWTRTSPCGEVGCSASGPTRRRSACTSSTCSHPAAGTAWAAPGAAVTAAFDAGLDVLVWTLRNENRHLPQELRSPGRPRSHGDAATEVARLFDLGVDGVLTDFPETAVQVRASRTAAALLA